MPQNKIRPWPDHLALPHRREPIWRQWCPPQKQPER